MYIPRARPWCRALLLWAGLLLAGLVIAGVADAADLGGDVARAAAAHGHGVGVWERQPGRELPRVKGSGVPLTLSNACLRIAWGRAAGATTYAVLVTTTGGGRTLRVTRGRSVRITGIAPYLRGKVSVTGVRADGIRGRSARTPFRAQGRRRR
jgi:hypothetical protein